MIITERLFHVFADLGMIFTACVPLYFALYYVEKFSAWASTTFLLKLMETLDAKMTAARAVEKKRWAEQGRKHRN